jgi:hypothetical protein
MKMRHVIAEHKGANVFRPLTGLERPAEAGNHQAQGLRFRISQVGQPWRMSFGFN